MIKSLICKTDKRLTAREALEHPWIKKYAADGGAIVSKEVTYPKMDTLLNFDKYSKMKKIVLAAIATQLNPKDVKNLKSLFESLDTDDNGSLSLAELKRGLMDLRNGEELVTKLISADLDGSGEISYSEFLAATMGEELFLREDYLQAAFNMFDTDRSG